MLRIIDNRRIPFIVSGLLFVVSVVILATVGLRLGIDFTGGSLMELVFSEDRPSVSEMNRVFENTAIGSVAAQPIGENGMLLRMRFLSEEEHQQVLNIVRDAFGNETKDGVPAIREDRFETIGPAISSQLKQRSIGAAIAVVIAIIAYVAYSFRKVSKPVASWKYGVSAIIALIHDVVITMAILAILGRTMGLEMSIPIVVALLTILGYSVNDTIVVFDRIRENVIQRGTRHFDEMVNHGVNQTIIRSVNTSLTTLVVLFALYFFGGSTIAPFALTLIIGIVLGTYSSIFLASPLLVWWHTIKK